MEDNTKTTKPLQKEKIVTIAGKQFTIPFPKVRHQFDIEARKHMLSMGTYQMQEKANTSGSIFNLNMIDAIAHFAVIAPELPSECFGVSSYSDLDLLQAKEVVKAYLEFAQWYQDIRNQVNKDLFKENEDNIKD